MNKEEWFDEIEKINKEAEEKRKKIHINYAIANNSVKKGDIIRENYHSLKVDKIGVQILFGSDTPECVYYGVRYTSKGVPFKNMERSAIYQRNLTTKNE